MKNWVLLLRHAHRDFVDRNEDNGLSAKGHKQVQELSQSFLRHERAAETLRLISSPKLRCRETLEPLSKEIQLPLEVTHLLDEQEFENSNDFRIRLKAAASLLHEQFRLSILCSHGDWIPAFVYELNQEQHSVRKGEGLWLLWNEKQKTWKTEKFT